MPIEWIFFDAGNTIIGLDDRRVLAALAARGFRPDGNGLRRSLAGARPALDLEILQRWTQGPVPRSGWIDGEVWRGLWRRALAGCGAAPGRLEPLVDEVLSVIRPAEAWDRVDPGTPALLDDLVSRGHRLGVISNSSGTLAGHLSRIGIASRFSVIVDSGEAGVEKPHPDIFRIALDRAGGVPPSRAIHVGDVYAIDVLGASAAGLHAVLYDPAGLWSATALPDGAPACRTVRSLAELPSVIDRLGR